VVTNKNDVFADNIYMKSIKKPIFKQKFERSS